MSVSFAPVNTLALIPTGEVVDSTAERSIEAQETGGRRQAEGGSRERAAAPLVSHSSSTVLLEFP